MRKRKLILDCDPGQDDAINLLLAFAARDRFELLGITTLGGNAPLAATSLNARLIADLAHVEDVPIFGGADRPLDGALVTAAHVHGHSGLDGYDWPEPRQGLQEKSGVDFIVGCLEAAQDRSITLVPTGPLTNIALALRRKPHLARKIEEIVLMGGAMREGGNYTPSAEFNFYVDPLAAAEIMHADCPITIFSLDITHQILCTPDILARFKALGGELGAACYGMLSFFNRFDSHKYGSPGAPLHDPATMAYLLDPSLFALKPVFLDIEVQSPLTRGHSAVDFWGVTGKPANVQWAHKVDRDGFFDLVLDQIARLRD